MSTPRRRGWPLGLLLLLLGCSDETHRPPIVWEGDRLSYGTDDESVVCGGTYAYGDDLVRYLGEVFDRRDQHVEFYRVQEVPSACSDGAVACTRGSEIFSTEPFIQHELVHALRGNDVGYPPLEEGVAELFGDDWAPRLAIAGDLETLWSTHERGSAIRGGWYPLAGYYASYLRADMGQEPLLDFLHRSNRRDSWTRTQEVFSDAYGRSFDEVAQEWRESYPVCDQTRSRDNGFDCGRDAVELPRLPTTFELRVPMDCQEPTVIGPRRSEIWTTIALEVVETGIYEFGADKLGGVGDARLGFRECGQNCFSEQRVSFTFDFDVARVDEPRGGVFLNACMPAGMYTMRVAIDADDTGEVVTRFRYLGTSPGCE